MSPLSDEYIRSLEPETLRYDVTIFDDFVISVLPNGIKTWAFLYDYEGRKRRKTLGVYPDMAYAQAEDALDNVRGMITKLGDDIKDSPVEENIHTVEPPDSAIAQPLSVVPPPPRVQRPAVLAPRRRYRQHRPKIAGVPRGWLKPFGLGIAAVIALAAAVVVIPRLGLFDGDSTTSNATSRPSTNPERAAPKPIVLDQKTPDEVPTSAPKPSPEPVADARLGEPLDRGTASAAAQDSQSEPIVTQPPPPVVTLPVTPETIEMAETPARDPPDEIVAAAPPPAAPVAVDPSPTEATSAPTSPEPTPPSTLATAANGDVTRAIVTSNVRDLEPVDDLGEDISLNDAGFQTVFYFTELRNFTAGEIVHRWTYNGRIIADVPLRVDGGWRWRTYSSKDLLPGMTGDWSVSVIDADGRKLGERLFRFER